MIRHHYSRGTWGGWQVFFYALLNKVQDSAFFFCNTQGETILNLPSEHPQCIFRLEDQLDETTDLNEVKESRSELELIIFKVWPSKAAS